MMVSTPIEVWIVNTKIGWLVRPDFINQAIDEALIETIGDRWIVHGMNATTIVKDGDYIVCYENGIEVYTKELVEEARKIFNIIKE